MQEIVIKQWKLIAPATYQERNILLEDRKNRLHSLHPERKEYISTILAIPD
jgi:hypothetical protein|tara:strand:+ start:45 stop:197 length:153 start_codon:yes stop_codon:yes gene_type:complete